MTDDTNKSGDADKALSGAKQRFSKTPFFTAASALRYHRQSLIQGIEEQTKRKLLCYLCGSGTEIKRDDTIGFVDLLHNIPEGSKIDLILHTGGGDVDAAEKLIKLVQDKIGESGDIRAIVPDYAKSAGTLMALGAKSILMSRPSELGAIDPQFVIGDSLGNRVSHSVVHYLTVYEQHEEMLRKDQTDPVARMMFDKFDPAIIHKLRIQRQRVRDAAENLLMRNGMPFSRIASELMNVEKWKSHNQMITAEDARDEIGLNVDVIAQDDPLWEKIWQLHCLQRLELGDEQTLFESYYVSLLV